MKSAIRSGQSRAVEEGYGGFNPGVSVTPDGRLLFGQSYIGGAARGTPTYPNLQYWDYVQRDLSDMIEKVLVKTREIAHLVRLSLFRSALAHW